MDSSAPDARPDLAEYRAKRDFTLSPEPEPSGPPSKVLPEPSGPSSKVLPEPPGPSSRARPDPPISPAERGAPTLVFVVQRHRARRTHYDFRLEIGGVLASWAMPKGPSLDPGVRSLAVHVEDHPIEYRDFEGVIPAGQYGGGDVIVWDRGTWQPSGTDDPGAAVVAGELHFDLFGEKLRGRFVLVRTRVERGKEQWLMLHKHDLAAQPGWAPDHHPRSVKTGRTNEEVRAAPASVWHSDRPPSEAEVRVGSGWEGPTPDELQELDSLGSGGVWNLGGQDLRLTNLDKVLFAGRPGEGPLTKRDLIRYYATMAPLILPYLHDRPVNLHRFPNGADRPGFWHKQVPGFAPEWMTRWRYEDAGPGDSEFYFVLDSVPAMAWIANYGAVELHPWTSRIPDVQRPTWALVDIDPGEQTTPEEVLVLARLFRTGLQHLGVEAAPKVTGQRGIHIWIPVQPEYSFAETSAWVEKLSKAVGATVPDLVSWTWQKSARRGLARLDYTQNAINKTLAAPYSVRPARGAPVSAPITWDALDDPGLRSDGWTIRTMADRGGTIPDRGPSADEYFAGMIHKPQRLPSL